MDGGKRRDLILVVEDDPDLCNLICTVLEDSLEVETVRAEDGELALELIRSLRPDLVLLDIGLPKVNGLEVARTIKHDPGPGRYRWSR